MWRASRSANRLASVADRANCQAVSPNRRVSSSPTQAASSVGSMWVMPRRIWRSTAAIVGRRSVAGHRPGVAEAEVDVVVAVDAAERGAGRGLDVERERPGPLDHPGHRHALEERGLGALVELGRARVLARERLALGGMELGETGPIDGAIGGRVRGHPPMMAASRGHPAVIPPGATWSVGAMVVSAAGAGSRRWGSWRPRCRDRPRGSWRSRSSRSRGEAPRSRADACGASPSSVRRRTPSWFGST